MPDKPAIPASQPTADRAADDLAPGMPAAGTGAAGTMPKPPATPDPTRYGDWEKNGRCIDF